MEDIEPEERINLYREIAQKQVEKFNKVALFLISSNTPAIAIWQFCFAFNLDVCDGQSMTKIANKLKVTRAALSKGATELCRKCDMPPSSYMKSEEAQGAYRQKRKAQVTRS